MIRTLGGIAAGLATAMVLMIIVEGIGNQLAPIIVDVNLRSDEAAMGNESMLPLMFPILGWFLAALVGGWMAIRVSGRSWTAGAVAGIVFLATVADFLLSSYPWWMTIAGAIAPLVGGYLAHRLAAIRSRRTGRASG